LVSVNSKIKKEKLKEAVKRIKINKRDIGKQSSIILHEADEIIFLALHKTSK
jgi:hypothetical protein